MIQKNISYADLSPHKNLLDVIYEPGAGGRPVIFFIHGGSWMSGSKDLYTGLGENFLTRDFVSVIISYRLFPATDVYGMVDDCRSAFAWCLENVENYGGDKRKIYLMGHSAGGHLAAVTALSMAEPLNNIAGLIMVDAFGLSAHYFLSAYSLMLPDYFARVFGTQKEKWLQVSPDKMVRRDLPPFLILTGGSTYPFVAEDNRNFSRLLKENGVSCRHLTQSSLSHMQMILQFENKKAAVYDKITAWIEEVSTG
jgi:acetyl esterase/lipase